MNLFESPVAQVFASSVVVDGCAAVVLKRLRQDSASTKELELAKVLPALQM